MSQYDCQLTLALPSVIEEEVLDLLLAHPEAVRGFTVLHGEGFGAGSHLRSSLEQVRGRAQRTLITLLMQRAQLAALLDVLRAAFPSEEVAWWSSAIDGFGRLA